MADCYNGIRCYDAGDNVVTAEGEHPYLIAHKGGNGCLAIQVWPRAGTDGFVSLSGVDALALSKFLVEEFGNG